MGGDSAWGLCVWDVLSPVSGAGVAVVSCVPALSQTGPWISLPFSVSSRMLLKYPAVLSERDAAREHRRGHGDHLLSYFHAGNPCSLRCLETKSA